MTGAYRAELRLPAATLAPWTAAGRATPAEHLATLHDLRLSGYALFTAAESRGAALLRHGAPTWVCWDGSSSTGLDGPAAFHELLRSAQVADGWAQPLPDGLLAAVSSLFGAPQPCGPWKTGPVDEFKELLRALAVLRHTGAVDVTQDGVWARALLVDGRVVGSYGSRDGVLRPSLAPCAPALEPGCAVRLYTAPATDLEPLPLPTRRDAGSAERDEKIETDLVWLLSRHERLFTRVHERGARPNDVLRALAALFGEAAAWLRAVAGSDTTDLPGQLARLSARHPIVAELPVRGDALDGDALVRQANAQRKGPAGEQFRLDVARALLAGTRAAVLGVLAHVDDPATAARGREAAESLLREIASVALAADGDAPTPLAGGGQRTR